MDKQKALRIEEIFIPPQEVRNDYFCENFIIFPDGKEKYGGNILGIIEINATPTQHAQKISKTIISNLQDHYYRQIVTSPDPQKLNIETIFEHALQKTNEQVLQLIQIGQIKLVLENINFIIAVVIPKENDTDIYFSHRGNLQNHLVHKTKKENYKIIDIVANTHIESDSKVKIFSSIISGKIFLPDTLIISNEGFARFFSPEKISQIITNRPLKEVSEDFKVLLSRRPENYDRTFSAIMINQEDIQLSEQVEASQESIDSMVNTQKDTEKFLTPAIGINIKERIKGVFSAIINIFKPKSRQKGVEIDEIRASDGFFKKIFKKFKLSKSLSKKTKEPKGKIDYSGNVKTKSTKYIAIVIVVLIIALGASIYWIYNKRQDKKVVETQNVVISSIENKLNQAEAAFLFRNTDKSMDLMTEAKNLISKLPQETEEQKKSYKKIQTQYTSLSNKLLKLESVQAQEITIISSLTTQSPKIETLNGKIIVSDKGNLHIIDKSTNQISQTVETGIQNNVLGSYPFTEEIAFILYENNELYQYDAADNSFSKVNISSQGTWTDLFVYNQHLYFLSPADNQIYKLRNVGSTSFGPPDAWISEEVNLADANSLAIDGDILVLSSNGTIQKFLSGDKQSFSIQNIEPALQSTSELFTHVDSNFIYLLDKPTKRIIVLSKQGLIVVQYQVENINKIDDITIDEANKKIYIIENNKVWAVGMKHL